MKKRDFETYQKRLRDFEILPKFSETHVFRGTIRHPYKVVLLFSYKAERQKETKGNVELRTYSREILLRQVSLLVYLHKVT